MASQPKSRKKLTLRLCFFRNVGPTLPPPHVDQIERSRNSNLKELRGKVNERHLRVLFAFDPRRTALLLLGGDKTDDPTWYDTFVPIADGIFDRHLKQVDDEK